MNSNDFMGESKPTSFPSIKKNAINAFNLDQIPVAGGKIRYENKPDSFAVYLKTDDTIRSKLIDYIQDLSVEEREEDAKEQFLNKLKQQSPRRYGNVTVDDLEVERYTDNQPRIKNGKLQPNVVRGNMKRISDYGKTYRDQNNVIQIKKIKEAGALTVDTVIKQIKDDADSNKFPYYNTVLGHLIKTKDQGFKPVVLVDDLPALKKAGLSITELLTDFGEVAGPIGLISKSINGNAVRVLSKFLGEDSTDALMKEAVIHFHASQGHMLVDSYIEFRGRVLRVSSKNAFGELSGGSGASPDGIFQSLEEIADMPAAKEAFDKLINSNPKYKTAMEQLRIMAKSFDASEISDNTLNGILVQFNLLKKLNEHGNAEISITDNDAKILQNIWALDTSQTGMHRSKAYIGAAMGSVVDTDQLQDSSVGEFSPAFKQLMKTFNLNRYGEPGLSGAEKINATDKKNSSRGWWLRLRKALVFNVAKIINSNPEFSTLCTWILNHGAFCQIDIRHTTQSSRGNKDDSALIINNITATWPSTVVDRVKLMPLPTGDSFRYKLEINGNRGFDERAYQAALNADDSLDYDFGFKTSAEQRVAMTPNKTDLIKNSNGWREQGITTALGIKAGKDGISTNNRELDFKNNRTNSPRGSRASSEMKHLFDYFKNNLNIISQLPSGFPTINDNPEAAYATVAEIAKIVVDGYTTRDLLNSITITMKNLHFMDDGGNIKLNEADDEEDDEEDVDDKPVTPANKAQATRFSTYAKNMLYTLYYAAMTDQAIKSENKQSAQKFSTTLYRFVEAIQPNVLEEIKRIVSGRLKGNPPKFNVDSLPPPPSRQEPSPRQTGASRQPRQPSAPRQGIEHADAYNSIKNFLVTHHVGDASGTDASAYRFAIKIIDGTLDRQLTSIAADFKQLMSSDYMRKLVQRETIDTIKHPVGIVSEAEYNPETAVSAITLIYWALTFKRYVEYAEKNPEIIDSAQYRNVVTTLSEYGNKTIRDGGTRRKFATVLRRIEKSIQSAKQTIDDAQ